MATYYKVPKSLDGKRTYDGKGQWYEFYPNELLTEIECKKIGISPEKLTKVEISRRRIYFFFGRRFEIINTI